MVHPAQSSWHEAWNPFHNHANPVIFEWSHFAFPVAGTVLVNQSDFSEEPDERLRTSFEVILNLVFIIYRDLFA